MRTLLLLIIFSSGNLYAKEPVRPSKKVPHAVPAYINTFPHPKNDPKSYMDQSCEQKLHQLHKKEYKQFLKEQKQTQQCDPTKEYGPPGNRKICNCEKHRKERSEKEKAREQKAEAKTLQSQERKAYQPFIILSPSRVLQLHDQRTLP